MGYGCTYAVATTRTDFRFSLVGRVRCRPAHAGGELLRPTPGDEVKGFEVLKLHLRSGDHAHRFSFFAGQPGAVPTGGCGW